MLKVVWFRLQQCLIPLSMLLFKGPVKRHFLHIYLTTFSGVCNFGNTSAMRVIFLCKIVKFNPAFKNAETNSEKVYCFWDNCIGIGCLTLFLLSTEYLSSAVNMLPNTPKTHHITMKYLFQLNCLNTDQEIW